MKRFWDKVEVKSDSECWNWTACKDRDGYGIININGIPTRAHRYSKEIHGGLDNNYPVVLHTCDNPSCVNPKHLENGTQNDNMKDMTSKLRHRYGSKSYRTTLTEEQAKDIKYSSATTKEMVEKYNVSKYVVYTIRSGKRWPHI